MSKNSNNYIIWDNATFIEQAYNLSCVISLNKESLRTIFDYISTHCFDFNSDQTCSSIIALLFKFELLIAIGLTTACATINISTNPKSLDLFRNNHINIFQYAYILYHIFDPNFRDLIENNTFIHKQLETHSIDLTKLYQLRLDLKSNNLDSKAIQGVLKNANTGIDKDSTSVLSNTFFQYQPKEATAPISSASKLCGN